MEPRKVDEEGLYREPFDLAGGRRVAFEAFCS